MNTDLALSVENYLSDHAFSGDERAAIAEFLGNKDSYEVLPPPGVCSDLGEVTESDIRLLDASASGRPFSVFPLRSEVEEVMSRLGVRIISGFYAPSTFYLETSLSSEQVLRDGEAIGAALSRLAAVVGARIYIRLCDSALPIRIDPEGGKTCTRGGIEYTRACAQALLGDCTDYSDEGVRVIAPVGRGEAVARSLSAAACPVPFYVTERMGRPAPREVVRAGATRELPPFIVTALGRRRGDSLLAVSPARFFSQLNTFVEDYQERFPDSDRQVQAPFWATGEVQSLHDDAWNIQFDEGDLVLALARPDPSFTIPQGGVIDCVAGMIRTSIYTKTGGCVVPMLPPDLARGRLSLSTAEPRPALVLRTRISLEGEILDVSLNSEMAAISHSHPHASNCPDTPEFRKLLQALSHKYDLSFNSIGGIDDLVEICGYLTRESSARFAESNGLPVRYRSQSLKSVSDRWKSFTAREKQIPPAVALAVRTAMEDDSELRGIIRRCPLWLRRNLEYMMYESQCYTQIKPAPEDCPWAGIQCAFGSPLRQYESFSTIVSWSRILRGRPALDLESPSYSTILRDILLCGVFQNESLASERFRVSGNMVWFDFLDPSPGIPVRSLGDEMRIKGISPQNGTLILK